MNPSETPPSSDTTAHLERKAGLLLAGVAAVILGFVLYVMTARGLFESTQQLVLISDDSEGVIVGMDLTFSGFPIGRVRRIELAQDGKARLVIDVPVKDARWLRTSSIFTMERGMVGDTRIRAFSGILSDPPLPADAERELLRGDTAAEIPRLVASARAILENLEAMTAAESSLNASLGHLKTTTKRMTGRYGVLSGVLGSDEQAQKIIQTLERTNTLLTKTDQRVFGNGGVMDDTQAALGSGKAALDQLHSVLLDTHQTLKNVDAVLAEAQAVGINARVATADLGPLRAEVEASLRKLSQLTNEVNRKWPFARDTEIKLP
ncbi:MAG: mammalian cell entry protein [Rhodoferax sp.]|nr:mammalian cell entry protein [Betaproteobacteria bacterium]NCN97825.1 mammalian cell entry protein [Rhodoferax sp.]OIP21586.1 MAG: mammalian cell entry protein [Comamonadaceae bacterium CG2_30_57_122]PIZ21805.1 MAG: mammalian cell entry protein [Comamonadaceae bacterium CG_4_10_14_0_8_um_filter_57_29]PJC14238.1 MAG: mammalian cell entry protein [Comamonadaceae bacterium CG_4_9_14_0_8_um_filter_57_21]